MPINPDGSFSGPILRPRVSVNSQGVGVTSQPQNQIKPVSFELIPSEGRPPDAWVNKNKEKEAALQYQRDQLAQQEAAQANQPKGGSVICTRFYELGYMDVYSYALDDAFGVVLSVYEPELMTWYSRHAPAVVRLMKHDGLFVRLLWRWFGKPWTEHMKHEMNPSLPNNRRGELFMNIGRFLCKL